MIGRWRILVIGRRCGGFCEGDGAEGKGKLEKGKIKKGREEEGRRQFLKVKV